MLQSLNVHTANVVPTVVFRIKIDDQLSKPFRAIFDSGAQLNLLSYKRVGELKKKRTAVSHSIRGIDGSRLRTKGKIVVEVYHRSKDCRISEESFVVYQEELASQPLHRLDRIQFEESFDQSMLADPNYTIPAGVDAVFGAGMLAKHLSGQMIQGPGAVVRQLTKFGWIVFGEDTTNQDTQRYVIIAHATAELNELIKKLWEINEVYDPLPLSEEDQYCVDEFARTVVRQESRYVVSMPLKPGAMLGESRHMALRRLFQIEAKFKRDSDYHQQYVEFMREYISLGHMRKASRNPEPLHCYICHHAVSVDRKFRVVFDGSVPTTNGFSLNSIQCTGPRLQRDLIEIVMSFRMGRIALSADIVKMYRQVQVHPAQWDLQRILWREQPGDPIEEYWLTTVTYGEAAAPFMAVSALNQCAKDFQQEYPRAANVVRNNFYMDDLLCAVDTEAEAMSLKQELTELLAHGGFELSKWTSNSAIVVSQDPAFKSMCEKDSTSVLGVSWNHHQDEFQFQVKERVQPAKLTKRVIASESARIFDPQGYLAPVTIRAKLLIQQLWKEQCEWDAIIPAIAQQKWLSLHQELPDLHQIQVPRWMGTISGEALQVHLFSDASELGYGITAYVRVCRNGQWQANLLCSRSKVAPVKTTTIPRLELCALELISKLVPQLRRLSMLENASYFYWTDSEVVLKWLRKQYGTLKIFVANRIEKIKEIADVKDIRHVESEKNPADLLTRGITIDELIAQKLWWKGPEFLCESREEWPVWSHQKVDKKVAQAVKSEQKKEVNSAVVGLTYFKIDRDQELVEKYSSFSRLCVVTAFIFRFLNGFHRKCKCPPSRQNPVYKLFDDQIEIGTGPVDHQNQTRSRTQRPGQPRLSTAEINHARNYWLRKSQQESFPEEYQKLRKGHNIAQGSRLQRLVPLMDDNLLLRITGRLNKLQDITSLETRPILLCAKNRVTHRIVEEAHRNLCHGGAQLTSQYLRQRYWILGIGNLVNSVIHQCITCTRYRAATAKQLMADIPRMRLIPGPAFESCGVDYAGPLKIKESRNVTRDAYIAVFVCMKYKAIHLELVSSLDTDSFLAALSRFINLRAGQVKYMYSDNGRNFVGANNKLRVAARLWESSSVVNFLRESHITWRFIPPAAPHHGGLWEAAVKSTKKHLKRMTGGHLFRFEELATLLAKIGACLNSRPITPISNDPTDLTALTPGHFLTGQPILAPFGEPMHHVNVG